MFLKKSSCVKAKWGKTFFKKMKLQCSDPHLYLQIQKGSSIPVFHGVRHRGVFLDWIPLDHIRLRPERIFDLLTHLQPFHIRLEMKTKVQN